MGGNGSLVDVLIGLISVGTPVIGPLDCFISGHSILNSDSWGKGMDNRH